MGSLQDKVAVVTGGTSGIGARTAEVFVEDGCRVVIAGRRREVGEALARRLGAAASFIQTDVADERQVKAMMDYAVATHGRLDCLVNNAGSGLKVQSIASLDLDDYDRAMSVLLRGVMLGMKYAAAVMIPQGSGSIINIGSVAGLKAGISSQTYSAAKAAVIHASRCVAVELGEQGIRVNSISPGLIVTGIFGKAAGLTSVDADRHTAAVAERASRAQPIPRAGLPDDIARAAAYLASDASSFVNGHDLVVDGGLIAGASFSSTIATREALASALRKEAQGGP